MKKFLTFVMALFACSTIFAQISLDPSHDFYKSAQSWKNRGYQIELPPSRPYSMETIKTILQTVIDAEASETDVRNAKKYWEEITGKKWHLNLEVNGALRTQNDSKSILADIEPTVSGEMSFLGDSLNLGYNAGWSVRNKTDLADFTPMYTGYSSDARFDPASIGPMKMYLNANEIISYQKKNIILQTGIYRNGYGDFINEGLALNESCYHKPSISFTYMNKYVSYNEQFFMLGATVNDSKTPDPKDTKYLAFHALELKPLSWISGSFYETCVFGKRMDFSYLLPVPYMVGQSFSGFADSLIMGVRLRVNPVSGLAFSTDLLVDDLDVNKLLKFNLDSKNRIAWNTGVEYTPEPKILEKISLNYLIVTPYTYTHWDVDDNVTEAMSPTTINYQNYTNCGYNIGSNVAPNSQQVKMNVDLAPVENLKLNLYGAFTQHSNITESLTTDEKMIYLLADSGTFSTDGSIYNHPHGGNKIYMPTAWNYMNFLTQAHTMLDFQAGLSGEYQIFKKKYGTLSVKAGYVFEYTHNKGVDSDMFPGGTVTYDEATGTYTYEGGTTTDTSEIVSWYENKWAANLYDSTSNYIYAGIKYSW